jgi:hypothetical protein
MLFSVPCGDTVYDPLSQVCCNDMPQPIMGGSVENTECCYQKSYDKRSDACCGDEFVYNMKNEMCCAGKVSKVK